MGVALLTWSRLARDDAWLSGTLVNVSTTLMLFAPLLVAGRVIEKQLDGMQASRTQLELRPDGAAESTTMQLLRPVTALAAVVTLPCMFGIVSPVGMVGVVQGGVQGVVGAHVNLSRLGLVASWMTSHPGLGLLCAVFAFVASIMTFRAGRLRDGALAVAWLAAFSATFSGHGRLLMVSFGILFCLVETTVALLDLRAPLRLAYLRYPMRLTVIMPIRYLFEPVVWVIQAATGYKENGATHVPESPTGAIALPPSSATESMMKIAYRRLEYQTAPEGSVR
jgi:hypothetical protein